MKLRNASLLIALGLSLAIHVCAIPVSVRVYFGGDDEGAVPARYAEMIVEWDARPREDLATHDPQPAPPDPAPEFPEFPIGERDGTGYASNESPGDREAIARQGESDQAYLSRDPSGTGEFDDRASMMLVQGDSGRGGTPGAPAATIAPTPGRVQPRAGEPRPLGSLIDLSKVSALTDRALEWAARVDELARSAPTAASPTESERTSIAAQPSVGTEDRVDTADSAVAKSETLTNSGDTEPVPTRRAPVAPVLDPDAIASQATVNVRDALVLADRPGAASSPAAVVVPPPGALTEGDDPAAASKPAPPTVASATTASPAGTGDGRAPGVDAPAADPAPMADTDSDPFSTLGMADFREHQPGRVSVRDGRKVKAVRPKLTLAGKVDVFSMQGARVVLNVAIDPTGKVTGVEVATSSGSNAIDQPCRRSLYDWWFEPKTDAAGKPTAERFQFTIVWH